MSMMYTMAKTPQKSFVNLREQAVRIIFLKRKKVKLLANEQQKSFGIFDPARKKRRKVRKLLHKD